MRAFLKKIKKELFASLTLAFTLFFFAPASIFILNARTIQISFGDIWYLYLIFALLVSIVLTIVTQISKPIAHIIPVFYIALSLGFFIQGNFLDFNLGTLDGHEILWESYMLQSWFELLIWIVVISLAFILKRYIYMKTESIFIIFMTFQISAGLIGFMTNPQISQSKRDYLDTSKEFEFSTEKNVIIVVLDTFSTDVFSDLLDAYPEYKEVFKDFIFFEDAVGGYPTTRPSVPLILSGEYYDNSIPIDEFVDQTREKVLPITLKKNNFIVERYHLGYLYYDSTYDNNTTTASIDHRISTIKEQYIVTGIRFTPLVLKPFFVSKYYEGEEYYHEDMVDFLKSVSTTKAVDRQPTFKFIHLTGAHSPFQMDGELNLTNAGYIGQASASLKLVQKLLAELTKVGVYDNSLIFVVGDHGTQGGRLIESAQPLMLAKSFDQNQDEMIISDSPVTLGDIPISIANELGIPAPYSGFSVFAPVPKDRVRNWFYYEWSHSNWESDFLPTMYSMEIAGPANQLGSYSFSRIHPNPNQEDLSMISFEYQYGQDIINSMLSSAIYRTLNSENFYYQMSNTQLYCWATAPKACLYLDVEPTRSELRVIVKASPFLVKDKLDDQRMNIYIDGHIAAEYSKDSLMEFVLTAEESERVTKDAQITLCFEFPDATKSPKDYGYNEDGRLLGYNFSSIIIEITNSEEK